MMLRLISSAKFRELHYGKKAQEMEDRRKVNNKQLGTAPIVYALLNT